MSADRAWRVARFGAIAADLLFILWIVRNGIDEGFAARGAELASYIALVLLLALNVTLIWRSR